jgi:hypothetical protein
MDFLPRIESLRGIAELSSVAIDALMEKAAEGTWRDYSAQGGAW